MSQDFRDADHHIRIPKQSEPVNMYDGRVYVRHGTESHRATPEEIKQLYLSHPSAAFKRGQEELTHHWGQAFLEESKSFGRRLDEQSRAATEAHNNRSRGLWGRLH
jgi:hypothetical protein